MARRYSVSITVTATVVGSLISSIAVAALEEIVVVAERREANVQDVPVAVSAFDTGSLERLQVTSAVDLGFSVPNLQTSPVTAGGMAIQVHMRGASVQNPGFATSESPVGIYQDGLYRGRLATSNMEFTDIERIEVLRGPQGTLYGRNTIAGAINVISRTPGDERWVNGALSFGEFETFRVRGSVGGPLSEGSLAASAAFVYSDRGEGWIDNLALSEDVGQYENFSGRGKLHWYGNESIDATLTVWAFNSDNDGWNGIPYGPDLFSPGFLAIDTGVPSAGPGGFYTQLTPLGSAAESDEVGVSVDVTLDLSDSISLTSITGYSDTEDEFDFDLSGGYALGIPGLFIQSGSENQQFSQEFLLQGTAKAISWTAGLYFLDEQGEQSYTVAANLPPTFPGFGPLFFENTENDTSSYAVFGELKYDLTDRLTLTAGLRWTREEKDFSYRAAAPTMFVYADFDISESFEAVTPKVTLDYQVTEDLLVYGTIAEGFQSGGFQSLCFGDPVCAATPFEPQDVLSYELGLKADLLNNRLRINGAVFLAQYDDIQQTAIGASGFPLQNVGEVDVTGIELEISANPVDGLALFGNLGYADEDYKSLNPLSGAALSGATELPGLPEHSGRIGFEYDVQRKLGNTNLGIKFGADYTFSDDYFSEVTNGLLIDSYGRTNAFIALAPDGGSWELRLEGRNITDEEDNVSGIFGNGVNHRTPLPPREIMGTIKLQF